MSLVKLQYFISLMRLDKPVGIFLLLWPTLWALWLASAGKPDKIVVIIFIVGTFLMRSAGCVINDIADRKWDGFVARTRHRPLAAAKISVREALCLFVSLMSCAFLLVLLLNRLTVLLALAGAVFAIVYPFLKRLTHLPQIGLGVAFSWGVPMAFAALTGSVSSQGWLVFFTAFLWPIMYDTLYAMVDRADDLNVGVKSTAIFFGKTDKLFIGLLQSVFFVCLLWVGFSFQLNFFYYTSLTGVAALLLYQQMLIKDRLPANCFNAFLTNQWVGGIIFLGILCSYVNHSG